MDSSFYPLTSRSSFFYNFNIPHKGFNNQTDLKKKDRGAYFEYEEERNADLMRAFREVRSSHPSIPLNEVYRIVVDMPSSRFWVSVERASIVISSMTRGDRLESMILTKREMYYEIYARVLELQKERPDDSIYDLTFDVVNSPAPKFYLKPGSAEVIIHKIKHKWYDERKRKLRHLLM